LRKKDRWLNKLLVGSIGIDGWASMIGDYRLAHSPRSTSPWFGLSLLCHSQKSIIKKNCSNPITVDG
jgi:hypothetical protein